MLIWSQFSHREKQMRTQQQMTVCAGKNKFNSKLLREYHKYQKINCLN